MLGPHEVSRRSASLVGFVVGAVRRRAKNCSIVLGMGRSGTMDLDDRDSQGHPCTRGHVSKRTSRPRPQLGHAGGSDFARPVGSGGSAPFAATESRGNGSDDATISVQQRARCSWRWRFDSNP